MLLGLLARPGNPEKLAGLLVCHPDDLADAEVSMEWSFLRDLRNHHSRRAHPTVLRTTILDAVRPGNAAELETCSCVEFTRTAKR